MFIYKRILRYQRGRQKNQKTDKTTVIQNEKEDKYKTALKNKAGVKRTLQKLGRVQVLIFY